MSWQSLKIQANATIAEALSDALTGLGALSVSIEDADAESAHETPIFGEPGMQEATLWHHNMVSALFDQDADLLSIVHQAAAEIGLESLPYTIEDVPEQNWVLTTQAQFAPIQIRENLWIVPTWHDVPQPDSINIILDPGMAFGTGSHPTTHLCLSWLVDNVTTGDSVCDYGCGSGILAIAAKKLGAGNVVGTDIDEQAILASRQNAQQNTVEVSFYSADDIPVLQVDIVVANILSLPLKLLAPALAGACRIGGKIALSGILREQASEISAIYAEWFAMNPPVFMENWVLLNGVKR
ncbi:MAG TPA: 50S ribosomal protein L11 methyltransferase [Methylophilaceae bacterium]|jgi:ribosomal protein L11 methyltransferase